jgi:hypothetical protein
MCAEWLRTAMIGRWRRESPVMARMTISFFSFLAAAGANTLMMGACSPAPKSPNAPYLQRMTSTGGPVDMGPVDTCVDPAVVRRMAELRRSRAPAPKPLPGCTTSRSGQPDGSTRFEMTCDRAKGARSSYHMVSEGTPNDRRMHTETYGFDPNTGAPRTTVRDVHIVRLGDCPPDLKPGQMRTRTGTIMNLPSSPPLPVPPIEHGAR